MGPKKANAFMLFVFDRKKEAERNGEKFTVPEAVERFGDAWRTLPKEKRFPYEEKAKIAKGSNDGQGQGSGALAAHMRRNFGGPERPPPNPSGDVDDVFPNPTSGNQARSELTRPALIQPEPTEPEATGFLETVPVVQGRGTGRGIGRGWRPPRVEENVRADRPAEADQEVPESGW